MTENMAQDLNQKEAFLLKGSLQTLTIMHLQTQSTPEIDQQLQQMIQQTPKFFHQLPIVIDLHHFKDSPATMTFTELAALFRHHNNTLVGVRSGWRWLCVSF